MIGLLAAAAVFLAAAGLAKLVRPAVTAAALGAARIPALSARAAPKIVRLVGFAEIAIGAGVVLVGGPLAAALLAAAFAALAAASWRLVQVAPGQSCGCFGAAAGAASHWHTAVNAACAVIGSLAVVRSEPSVVESLRHQAWLGPPILVSSLLLAWLSYLTITALPQLAAARARIAAPR